MNDSERAQDARRGDEPMTDKGRKRTTTSGAHSASGDESRPARVVALLDKNGGGELADVDEETLTALLSHRTIESAATALGVTSRTVYRRMARPALRAALEEARRSVYAHTAIVATMALPDVLVAMLAIVDDKHSGGVARMQAVKEIMALVHKAHTASPELPPDAEPQSPIVGLLRDYAARQQASRIPDDERTDR